MLFVLVITVLAAFLFSASLYIFTSRKIMVNQGQKLVIDGLLQTLTIASAAADTALSSGFSDSDVMESLAPANPESTLGTACIPFIIDNNNFEFSESSILPHGLSEKLRNGYIDGSFQIREIPRISSYALITEIPADGRIWLTASVRLPKDGRNFGIAQDITGLINGSGETDKILIGTLALAYFTFITLMFVILNSVTKPLKKLTDAAQRYSKGDFGYRISVPTSIREISVLAEAFNHMGCDLDHQRTSLETYSARLEETNTQAQDLVKKLSKRHHEQRELLEASIEANRTEQPDQVLTKMMERLYTDLELDSIAFFIQDTDGKFKLERSNGLNNQILGTSDRDRTENIIATLQLMEPQRTHADGDICLLDMPYSGNTADPANNITSLYERLYIPISTSDNRIGVLELNAGPGREFDNAIIDHLRQFTSLIEVILHNKALYHQTVRRSQELEQINRISHIISGELDMDVLIREVVGFTQDTIPAECSFIGLLNGSKLGIHHVSPGTAFLDDWVIDIKEDGHLSELAGGKSLLENDLASDSRVRPGGFIEANVFKSLIGCPIMRKDEVLGVICGFSHQKNAFSKHDLNFLNLLAAQVAIAMQNARMFEEILARDSRRDYQLSMAQKLQENRVPTFFKQNVAAVHSKLKAADELAGDFCDVFSLGRNSIALIVGDVANKGVAASLMTFSLLSMFRNIAKSLKPPCEIMETINRALTMQIKDDGWFATGFYARLNTHSGTLTYSSAGHEQPIWFHKQTGLVEQLDALGYPLGLFRTFPYETREIKLEQGDRLILYTDGVTDATDPDGSRFGHQRLLDLIRDTADIPAEHLADTIIDTVLDFSCGRKQRDDIIVVVCELQDDPWIHKNIKFSGAGKIIDEILEALAPYEIDQQLTYSIRLSVDETLTNAWRHGLNQDNNAEIEVSYAISDDGFRFRVKDPGQGFDHESLPDPTVEENLYKSHGRGVFLIRQMMDEVEFNESGNELSIYKKFMSRTDEDESVYDALLLGRMEELKKQKESLEDAKNAPQEILSRFDTGDDDFY